jgi:hypothetical protein
MMVGVARKDSFMALMEKPEPVMDEIAILGRVFSNSKGIPAGVARQLLKLEFSEEDKARMRDLALRNQDGALSTKEKAELHSYANAGCLLGILHSKARMALKQSSQK